MSIHLKDFPKNKYMSLKNKEYRERKKQELKKYQSFYSLFHTLFSNKDINLINDYNLKLKLDKLKNYDRK